MVSEGAEGPRRTDVKCRRTKTSFLEPRVLAEDKTTNEVDEAILKSMVTGIVQGVCRKILKKRNKSLNADNATSRARIKTTFAVKFCSVLLCKFCE